MKIAPVTLLSIAALAPALHATEFHVALTGKDSDAGTRNAPFHTIQHAADLAQPGDVITVHAGVYRERINPPRGGESETKRIVYQAAPGEKVVITGSEPVKGWSKVTNDTWSVTIPNSFFGDFNPYAEKVHGDWFSPQGRVHHRGCVYLGNESLAEAPDREVVMKPAGAKPLWFATVDGMAEEVASSHYLLNIVSFKPASSAPVAATRTAARNGTRDAPSTEGGKCVGFITQGCWLRYDTVDFGDGSESVEFRASSAPGTGGVIELRDGRADGELLGACEVGVSGDWQKWQTFTAKIKKTSGVKNIYLVIKAKAGAKKDAMTGGTDITVIYAQFPGVNPNERAVEINVRPTVFTPEKTNIDYLTVRGFDLRNAASNWAAPTSGQQGLVTAYWCKGWIIENNEISNSRCCGIALGKYSDEYDNKRGNKEGYDGTIADALKSGGWFKEKIGNHVVRSNHIHHCGQTGIVGSLGCAFSRIENNEIHDINLDQGWGGAEMAGIKFHASLDVVIKGNHIYKCGTHGGLWLDWMAQGTQVIGNLFHDNAGNDIFTEVNHGPFLIANNILLSPGGYLSNSQGGAYAHNLVLGKLRIQRDGRQTPYHKAHSTELAGRRDCPIGDVRWHNNLLAGTCNLNAYDNAVLPVTSTGNVFTQGAKPSKFDKEALIKADFDPGITLTQKADGWYLTLACAPAWATEQPRKLVTSEMLGKAVIPDLPFENPDSSPFKIDTDYFGKKRDATNPFPGPFESPVPAGTDVKVW